MRQDDSMVSCGASPFAYAAMPPARRLRRVFADAVSADAWSSLPLHRRAAVALFAVSDWLPWLADASRLVDAVETARIQRRRIPAHRDALTIAYALHRLLLGGLLDLDPSDVPLYRDARGCPQLRERVACTSLSHGDGLVALAVTAAGPVGIDIESIGRAVELPAIAGRVCHPAEVAAYASMATHACGVSLLQLWVRKEAVLKAAGIGLEVEMDTFSAANDATIAMPAHGTDPIHVRMLDAGEACVAAFAGPPGLEVDCRWVRPMPSMAASSARRLGVTC